MYLCDIRAPDRDQYNTVGLWTNPNPEGSQDVLRWTRRSSGSLHSYEQLSCWTFFDIPHLHSYATRVHFYRSRYPQHSLLALRTSTADHQESLDQVNIGSELMVSAGVGCWRYNELARCDLDQAGGMAGYSRWLLRLC